MGAHTIFGTARGTTAEKAYNQAVSVARSQYGTDPYNGTVSTFNGYEEIRAPKGSRRMTRMNAIYTIFANDDLTETQINKYRLAGFMVNRIQNTGEKWERVGMMRLNKNEFLFWGWAAS